MRSLISPLRLVLAAAGLTLLTGGCAHYTRVVPNDTLMHPQFKTLALGAIKNQTDEPGLSIVLRQKLAEAFRQDGALRLVDAGPADLALEGAILRYTVKAVAASKRADVHRNDNRDKYQTTTYEVEVEVEFTALIPETRHPVVSRRSVLGTAQYTRLPDSNMTRDEALRRAVLDAAQQVVTGVTEAW